MDKKMLSVKITKGLTVALCVALTGLMVGMYPILAWYFGNSAIRMRCMLICFYLCCPAAWVALISILRLLNNVLHDSVFSASTVKIMRILSLCCGYVTLICAGGCYFSPALLVFGCGAAFMTLLLWVLKNVMQRATEIKEENDMTV